MFKYLIRLVVCFLTFATAIYLIYLDSPYDYCENYYCFKFVNIDQYLLILLNFTNIVILIYALNTWKDQHNTNHINQTRLNILKNIETLEEHRLGFELIMQTIYLETKQEFDPEISLSIHFSDIQKKFKELRYSELDTKVKYYSLRHYLHHFYRDHDHDQIPEVYAIYIEYLDNMYNFIDKKNWKAFNEYYEEFEISNTNLKKSYTDW